MQKVRRKVKRENQRLAEAYSYVTNEPKSAIGSLVGNDPNFEADFQMVNHVTTGMSRKIKKKMKKLQRDIPNNPDKVFKEIVKFK